MHTRRSFISGKLRSLYIACMSIGAYEDRNKKPVRHSYAYFFPFSALDLSRLK